MKDPITLNNLISILNKIKLKKKNGDCEVEFWAGEEQLELESIGHFNVIPNTTITLKNPSAKINYTTEIKHYIDSEIGKILSEIRKIQDLKDPQMVEKRNKLLGSYKSLTKVSNYISKNFTA